LGFYLQQAQGLRRKLMTRVGSRSLHDFRTSLRRAESVMRLEKYFLGKTRFKQASSLIKRLLELTGPLREAYVVPEVIQSAGLDYPGTSFQGLARERETDFQGALAAQVFDRLFGDIAASFQESEGAAEGIFFKRRIKKTFDGERERLRESLKAYESRGPKRKILHRLRIRAKRLGYALEVFGFLRRPRKKLLRAAKQVHDSLGELRDFEGLEGLWAASGQNGAAAEALKKRRKQLLHRAQKSIGRLDHALA
jgi:CHAD domain-containing protein